MIASLEQQPAGLGQERLPAALRENLPQAVWFVNQIRLLYRIEDEARQMAVTDRAALRGQHARTIWDDVKAKAEALRPTLLPKSTMGKAIGYFLNEYDALIGYLASTPGFKLADVSPPPVQPCWDMHPTYRIR